MARGCAEVLPEGLLARQLDAGRPLRVKLGIDPTAPDIHLGHVVVLTKLRQFQDDGHIVVLIIGDQTARVGDPTGRSSLRPNLSDEQIAANAKTFTEQAFKVLDRERCEVRFNSEWLEMPITELFGLARRFTVAQLLERDDFAKRIAADAPISLLELLYPLLQGYDSVAVQADLELGGTDQKFNLLFGRGVQSSFGMSAQSVMTMPILPGTDGARKMSKSYGNYIAVSDPPEEIFGKTMSIPDELMGLYYELILGEAFPDQLHPGQAKRRLAHGLVARFHNQAAAAAAEQRFDAIHVNREVPTDIPIHSLWDLVEHTGETAFLPAVIAAAVGSMSNGEARRLIDQGGVRIAGDPCARGDYEVPVASLLGATVQIGKRRFFKIDPGPRRAE